MRVLRPIPLMTVFWLLLVLTGCVEEFTSARSIQPMTSADTTQSPSNAEEVLAQGMAEAARKNQHALVIIAAPWCDWCHTLEEFLTNNEPLFAEYRIVIIDQDEMINGKAVSARLMADRLGGLPWFVIFDENGQEVVTSISDAGRNIGFPVTPGEVSHFLEMIRRTSDKSEADLKVLEEVLYAKGKVVRARNQIAENNVEQEPKDSESDEPPPCPDLAVDPTWSQLAEETKVWIDVNKKVVIVGGEVCFREGPLEFFACPPHTKEYESVIVVDCKSYLVHAALLAVGINPGHPVVFSPEYQAAVGPVLDISVEWDESGERRSVRAQEFVKHVPTDKVMPFDWVFAGSGFWKDEETGEEYYHAEGGELICLSNFSTATIDLPVKSSQENAALLFAAYTENIPRLGTKVYLKIKAATPSNDRDETTSEPAVD